MKCQILRLRDKIWYSKSCQVLPLAFVFQFLLSHFSCCLFSLWALQQSSSKSLRAPWGVDFFASPPNCFASPLGSDQVKSSFLPTHGPFSSPNLQGVIQGLHKPRRPKRWTAVTRTSGRPGHISPSSLAPIQLHLGRSLMMPRRTFNMLFDLYIVCMYNCHEMIEWFEWYLLVVIYLILMILLYMHVKKCAQYY